MYIKLSTLFRPYGIMFLRMKILKAVYMVRNTILYLLKLILMYVSSIIIILVTHYATSMHV